MRVKYIAIFIIIIVLMLVSRNYFYHRDEKKLAQQRDYCLIESNFKYADWHKETCRIYGLPDNCALDNTKEQGLLEVREKFVNFCLKGF